MFLFYAHHITPFWLDISFSNYGWLHFRYWRDTKLIYPADLWNLLHFLTALKNQRKCSVFFSPSMFLIRLSLFCINFYRNSDKEHSWALALSSLVSASLALSSVFSSRHTLSSFCSLSTFFCSFLMVTLASSLSTITVERTCFSCSRWAIFCRRRFMCSSLLSNLSFCVFSWFD